MVATYDYVNGYPPRIYREPAEIRRDIARITQMIDETSAMLNIRALLIDILSHDRADKPESLIPDLELAIEDAKEALSRMNSLKEELSLLEEELEEVKWILKR